MNTLKQRSMEDDGVLASSILRYSDIDDDVIIKAISRIVRKGDSLSDRQKELALRLIDFNRLEKVIKKKRKKKKKIIETAKQSNNSFADVSKQRKHIVLHINVNDKVNSARIRTLSGLKYNEEKDFYYVRLTKQNINRLIDWDITLTSRLQKAQKDLREIKHKPVLNIKGELRLFPYQEEGVKLIEKFDGRVLLADEMGLGKTIQALAWLNMKTDLRPALVVCPSSVKYQWAEEAIKWMDDPTIVLVNGMSKEKNPTEEELLEHIYHEGNPENLLIIINYDILTSRNERHGWLSVLKEIPFDVLVFDESHMIQNRGSNRSSAILEISKKVPYTIAISGTPITSRPDQFWPTLNVLQPSAFDNYYRFRDTYCEIEKNRFGKGMRVVGSKNLDQLHQILKSTVMIRRLKKDVLKELPDKITSIVPIILPKDCEYNRAEEDFQEWLREEYGDDAASKKQGRAKLIQLKRIAGQSKLQITIEWIKNFLSSGQKLVAFAIHRSVVRAIEKEFKDICVRVDGNTSAKKKHEAKEKFQNDKNIKLFIGNIKAAGVGLTLTAASNVLFIELAWTPADHDQAGDRIHRISQMAKVVNIWYLIARDTIEQRIMAILDDKRVDITRIMEGEEVDNKLLLEELLRRYYHTLPNRKAA